MSECVGVCQMDEDNQYCIGCGRSAAEIFGDEEDAVTGPPVLDAADTPLQLLAAQSGQ